LFESSGLTQDLLVLYRALLQRPELGRGTRLNELAAEVGRTADETSRDLEKLRKLGFLVPSWIEDVEYPLDPATAFSQLAASRQEEIDALSDRLRADQLAANRFTADLANYLTQRTARDTEIVEGRELANQRMQRFHPMRSIWGAIQANAATTIDPQTAPDRIHLNRGVQIRYLYPDAYWRRPGAPELIRQVVDWGGTVRISPSVPFRMIIFDGESVVMGIDPEDQSVGIVVHHSRAVVQMAEELYFSWWDRAMVPFAEEQRARGADISPQEAEFLRLLVRGETDEQVARKLGVSLRTVRRIAAKLSTQVGASGRFELGVRAAQRGWVD
jgi:DNA-binding CsgD family transcriptional regulator